MDVDEVPEARVDNHRVSTTRGGEPPRAHAGGARARGGAERGAIQMRLQGAVTCASEVDETPLLVHGLEGLHHPFPPCDLGLQCPRGGVQVEVAVAAALRRPQEAASSLGGLERPKAVVQVHPGGAAFLEQGATAARGGVEAHQLQALLGTVLELHEEAPRGRPCLSGGLPADPSKVLVRALWVLPASDVHPNDRPATAGDDA